MEKTKEEFEVELIDYERVTARKTFYTVVLKRFFDIFFSLIAIMLSFPICLVTYIISLIILRGNPLFVQYRPGKDGKIFKMYKFRSMTNKKDENGNLLPDSQRITKWGKIIRRLNIDELPQFLNILKGEMSFVGPRPRLIKDMIFYSPEVMRAYVVKPGLTGPAQVYDRSSSQSWESVFERDLEYAKNESFKIDLKLLIKTFTAIFERGAENGAVETQNKRDYYYADYLLKNGKISKKEYDEGIEAAKALTRKNDLIEYQKTFELTKVEK